ncbi:flagellar biosynthesis anti-sigma factor FlgM [Paenibacillus woosongensis]|uniref:flagellar biosynthesis anti-sigma factor FlgM n=1 Tax=Paenibacillus woosongensis TaxID=307580 RepID=UPI003D310227
MNLKINETGRINGVNPYQRNVENRDTSVDKKKQRDQLSISSEARIMLEEHNQVQDPKRMERIAELKKAVSTGTYHVEANKLAEKLAPYFNSFVDPGDSK